MKETRKIEGKNKLYYAWQINIGFGIVILNLIISLLVWIFIKNGVFFQSNYFTNPLFIAWWSTQILVIIQTILMIRNNLKFDSSYKMNKFNFLTTFIPLSLSSIVYQLSYPIINTWSDNTWSEEKRLRHEWIYQKTIGDMSRNFYLDELQIGLSFNSPGLGTRIGDLLVLVILVVIALRYNLEQSYQISSKVAVLGNEESKKLILGMIRATNEVDLTELANITGKDLNYWKLHIYRLIGEDIVSGKISDNKFILDAETNIDLLIDNLFQEYSAMEEQGLGKQ
ncbi:MAG: hypothetical protein GPJ54_22765 [Candidatus Heimdallarchaeota archaeon]|nr:hypothetical protein [Candidatus Heimdallarchaeota archaeon]